MTRYLSAEKMVADDFGVPFMMVEGEFVYDAATFHVSWATITERSWAARDTLLRLIAEAEVSGVK